VAHVNGTDDGAGYGVEGQSDKGVGVWGRAAPDSYLQLGPGGGRLGINSGQVDITQPPKRAGVVGESDTAPGVYGTSTSFDAVVGETHSDAHAGVTGRNLTKTGVGVYGTGGQYAGSFNGAVLVTGDAHVTGTLNVDTDIILTASDCAEHFDVVEAAAAEPGTVMVLHDSGALEPSSLEYDRKVAGVVSGAGDFRPGLILGVVPSTRARTPIALSGKVFCKVDAQHVAIVVGDLLTTSSTPGHAMKACDPARAFGAVIGKAMAPLEAGLGLIPVLVALQ
jgi:hypothetical protein